MTAALLAYGMVMILVIEWANPATLGGDSIPAKLLNAWFQSVSPRSAGFNSIDYSTMNQESWLVTDTLMFVGGGSVSIAGGIRVTTLAILFFVLMGAGTWRQRHRRGPTPNWCHPRATSTGHHCSFRDAVGLGTLGLMMLSEADLDQALFEVISALTTSGLSVGLTPTIDTPAQVLLAVLMFIGRVGPLTLAAALALRDRNARYRYPEGRLLVG